ncbi:MAG: hypothetical protein M3Y42_08835 [Actinomycetota bacterium]|nr:hypothetical protein [Actinomycetota bacterium]MDQ2957055.1 hypothetical protein [Actinomycetota bacterium]
MKPARQRSSRVRWLALLFPILIFLVCTVLFVAGAIRNHGDADLSTATQRHGVRLLATVRATSNHVYQDKAGTHHTAQILLTLPQPVAGRTESTAHLPYRTTDQPGDQIIALVNSHDPSYAELPGSPMASASGWKFEFGFAGFFGLLVLAMTGLAIRLQRRPQSQHTSGTARAAA